MQAVSVNGIMRRIGNGGLDLLLVGDIFGFLCDLDGVSIFSLSD